MERRRQHLEEEEDAHMGLEAEEEQPAGVRNDPGKELSAVAVVVREEEEESGGGGRQCQIICGRRSRSRSVK